MISFIGNIHNKKILRDRKISDCQTGNGYRVYFGVAKCFKIDCGDGCTTL